ncbi:MAG TPA: peptidoglycan-binding domain-containing protein, partial [Candidatus Paceibacterota bacterium]
MAITPGAGFMVSPDNPNAVIPIGSGASVNNPNFGLQTQGLNAPAAPAATSAPTPAPQMQSPAVPQAQPQQPQQQPQQQTPAPVTVNVGTPQTQPQGQTQGASQPQTAPPGTSLQPGAQGQDVQNLQNWLVQHGYLSSDQIGTGAGVYGPQTTAAVAKLQKDLGVNPGTGAGYYGPQTQQALAQKYGALHSALTSSGAAPDTSAAGREAVQGALDQSQNSNNPVMGALSASMAPIMQSLAQVLNNINNPALTATSLQTEYNQLRDQYGLPEMQSQLLNMNRIMNGTEQDIRDEVTAAGGFATESQVQGIAASRNKVILKQYNALSTQYDAAQQNVQAQMQYAGSDISNTLQRTQLTASVTESLASIQNQMTQMGMTMQSN